MTEIVRPSAMQRVAQAITKASPVGTSASTASPAERSAKPQETLRYSDITPAHIPMLRISAALESCYPHVAEKQGNRRASVILAGWEAWRVKRAALMERRRQEAHG